MKTRVFWITEEKLLEAMKLFWDSDLRGKDYEYAISIYVKRIFENQYKKPFVITFELDAKHQETEKLLELPSNELANILRTYLEEHTEVDFGLAPVMQDRFEGYSYPFQVKRFIGSSLNTFQDDLLNFIQKKSKHYRTSDTSFVVIPELKISNQAVGGLSAPQSKLLEFSEVFLRGLSNKINVDRKSLRSILVFSLSNNSPVLTQIYPNFGEYRGIYKL